LFIFSAFSATTMAAFDTHFYHNFQLFSPLRGQRRPFSERLAEFVGHFNAWAGTPLENEVQEALAMVFTADELRAIVNDANVPKAVREAARKMPETEEDM